VLHGGTISMPTGRHVDNLYDLQNSTRKTTQMLGCCSTSGTSRDASVTNTVTNHEWGRLKINIYININKEAKWDYREKGVIWNKYKEIKYDISFPPQSLNTQRTTAYNKWELRAITCIGLDHYYINTQLWDINYFQKTIGNP
jgi:hypothetical protein